MKTIFKFMILTFIALPGCLDLTYLGERHYQLENNSSSDIYIYEGTIGRENGGVLYPDTVLMNSNVTQGPYLKESTTYTFFNHNELDTISIFIFSADTLEKYSWEEVRSGYKVLQRYDLDASEEGFMRLNNTISYPPTEVMKDVKMYPPYKENK